MKRENYQKRYTREFKEEAVRLLLTTDKSKQGLSIQRIYQDLIAERQFGGSYHAVRRFVLRRVDAQELPFWRMECAPGQELQAKNRISSHRRPARRGWWCAG